MLTHLMRHGQDDGVRTRCAEIIIERRLGKPRDAVEEMLASVKVNARFTYRESRRPSMG
jgi:hypothetical protein